MRGETNKCTPSINPLPHRKISTLWGSRGEVWQSAGDGSQTAADGWAGGSSSARERARSRESGVTICGGGDTTQPGDPLRGTLLFRSSYSLSPPYYHLRWFTLKKNLSLFPSFLSLPSPFSFRQLFRTFLALFYVSVLMLWYLVRKIH